MNNNEKLSPLIEHIDLHEKLFGLAFVVFDEKDTLNKVLSAVNSGFPGKHIAKITMQENHRCLSSGQLTHSFGQIKLLARNAGYYKPPIDALFITGCEQLLPTAIGIAHSPDAETKAIKALQPINLMRESFPKYFPYPVVFCLPCEAMQLFMRYAVGLVSWQSGVYQFHADDFA